MAKGTETDEVSIVRFFENGPLDKVEVVFAIIRDKMQQRLRERALENPGSSGVRSGRKRESKANADNSGSGEAAS